MSTRRAADAPGRAAEHAAARFLQSQGYTLLARNYSTRAGEIDIIAVDGDTICFVEVRSRSRSDLVPPHASIGRKKQAHLRAAATRYLDAKRLHHALCRFDVMSLVPDPDQKSGWAIELLRDAF